MIEIYKNLPKDLLNIVKGYVNLKRIIKDMKLIKKDGHNLRLVKDPIPEMYIEACKQNGKAIIYIEKQTPLLCYIALRQQKFDPQFRKDYCFVKKKKILKLLRKYGY